jgi:hypothetical protein
MNRHLIKIKKKTPFLWMFKKKRKLWLNIFKNNSHKKNVDYDTIWNLLNFQNKNKNYQKNYYYSSFLVLVVIKLFPEMSNCLEII